MVSHADLLEAFARTVRDRAAEVAVEAPEGSFTYQELDRLSNRLAHRLRALGVARDARVGISLPRGVLELAAMLATVKAGGAYLPLDPSHPVERVQTILEDASPQLLLLHPGSRLLGQAKSFVLEGLAEAAVEGQPDCPLLASASAEQLVYILFTSGSTGRPKGVEITRGALANLLGSMATCPGMRPSERLLAITTTSFDIAGLELFLPLCTGGTVVIADRETAQDPRKLRRKLESSRIDILQATPATWRLLLEAGWLGDRKLRMLCGGEAMSTALADRLLTMGGELWNVYGPTETTIWSSLQRIERGYDRITIGKPIDNTQIYVLDPNLQPLPAGQEGEIWIGGAGLARGYHRKPQLTAERFVDNPHRPGERLYRTGDLGRQLADGRFECLGRIDHQVKIRGFRIELGEIETTLRRVEGVSDALVVADLRDDGDARLIAYWVGPAKRSEVIAAAERSLPSYMRPAAYVALQTFPLNSNGKIDRHHLPKPHVAPATDFVASGPADDIERRVAWVFSQVLGIPDVPPDQSFFTLGGTSAMALKTVARLERELGIEFSMQGFFDAPTVLGVAKNVGKRFSPDAPIVARLREGKPGCAPLFCLFGVTLYQDLALGLTEDRPVFGIHIPFRYVPGKDTRPSLQHIGERYVAMIRGLQAKGPYHLLGLCFGGVVAYEVARQMQAAGEAVAMVTIIDAVLPHGVRVNRAEQLFGLLRKAWNAPAEVGKMLGKQLGRITAWTPLRRLLLLGAGGSAAPRPIELPVDGPEVDAEVARFAAKPVKLSTRVLVVCASQEPWPTYVRVAPDQGWDGWADSVVIRNVPANHLGVLRDPHVRLLAQALAELGQN